MESLVIRWRKRVSGREWDSFIKHRKNWTKRRNFINKPYRHLMLSTMTSINRQPSSPWANWRQREEYSTLPRVTCDNRSKPRKVFAAGLLLVISPQLFRPQFTIVICS